jgi:hypothetical protein
VDIQTVRLQGSAVGIIKLKLPPQAVLNQLQMYGIHKQMLGDKPKRNELY